MYKTKVDIPGQCVVFKAGTVLELEDGTCFYFITTRNPTIGSLIFDKSFVESHPEFFEKVEEKSLEDQVVEKWFGSFTKTYLSYTDAVKMLQEYHKRAGGWTDEDMMEFYHFVNTICPRESSIKNDLAAYRQKRGNQ